MGRPSGCRGGAGCDRHRRRSGFSPWVRLESCQAFGARLPAMGRGWETAIIRPARFVRDSLARRPAILVLVGRYGLSTSWPGLSRPSPQHGAAMDGRNKSGHDDVATRWAKMRIAARRRRALRPGSAGPRGCYTAVCRLECLRWVGRESGPSSRPRRRPRRIPCGPWERCVPMATKSASSARAASIAPSWEHRSPRIEGLASPNPRNPPIVASARPSSGGCRRGLRETNVRQSVQRDQLWSVMLL